MKDAAVNRLAKSITQLTLCQVTPVKLMLPPNCLTKHARSFRASKISQRVTDLEAATRQLRQINCILDSCTISASYEVSQAQKALLLLPHTAKGTSTSSDTNELVASHRVSVFGFVLVLLLCLCCWFCFVCLCCLLGLL